MRAKMIVEVSEDGKTWRRCSSSEYTETEHGVDFPPTVNRKWEWRLRVPRA